MKLTLKEQDPFTIFTLAELARQRKARGIQLNHPEAVALITDEVMEEASSGRFYDEMVVHGMQALTMDEGKEGLAELASTLYIEPLFQEGLGRLSIGGEAGVRIWADEAAVLRGQLQLPERLTACAQALEEAGLPVGDLSTCQQETVLRIEIEVVEDGVGPVLAAVRVEGVQRARVLDYVDDAIGAHSRGG
jgi:urease subunit gamma